MSYQLHDSGVVVPHIAAGVNLNLPVIGPILRRGGAFFLRRSFKGNALYSVVFNEYVAQLIDRGVPIEYFIEGGRSRTGRLLAPRGRHAGDDRARVPARAAPAGAVPAGLHRLREADGGQVATPASCPASRRKRNRCSACSSGLKVLRQRYGHVALNFGEPIELTPMLDAASADWREASGRSGRQAGVAQRRGRPAGRTRSRSTSTAPRTSIRSTCWRWPCWPRPSTRWPRPTCWRSWS